MSEVKKVPGIMSEGKREVINNVDNDSNGNDDNVDDDDSDMYDDFTTMMIGIMMFMIMIFLIFYQIMLHFKSFMEDYNTATMPHEKYYRQFYWCSGVYDGGDDNNDDGIW